MPGVVLAALLVLGLWFFRRLGQLPPQEARAFMRRGSGYGLMGLSAFLLLHGLAVAAIPLFLFGAGLVGWNSLPVPPFSRQSPPPPAPKPTLSEDEAYEVLGLKPGATSEDVKAAHKRLAKANHPDAGGSTWLAARINAARDKLLKR